MFNMQDFDRINTILLDIEGTICPISWVKDTLFSYAIQALPNVLRTKWDDPEFVKYRDAFPLEARSSPERLHQHVLDLTERDVKIAYLKDLQGYLWQSGFESRAYSAPLFSDVLPALQRWCSQGRSCSIYSSGSVFAQKLLFAHIKDTGSTDATAVVDHRDLIDSWFDTTNAGPKTSPESYQKIATTLKQDARNILFLSDNINEIKAAQNAGMAAITVERPGNPSLSVEDTHVGPVVSSFETLLR